jgi:hypothetical protein
MREDVGVAELRVPPVVEDAFRAHYRALILGSALRVLEADEATQLARGRRRRARRAERAAARLRGLVVPPVDPADVQGLAFRAPAARRPRFGRGVRRAVATAWLAAAAVLGVAVAVSGPHGVVTGACDVALVALTFAWFAAAVDDLAPPPAGSEQLSLFR